MEEYKKHVGGGLNPTPVDERDLVFGAVFGTPTLAELPNEYKVGEPLGIKDQGSSDLCTAYAVTACSEDQEDIALSPEFQFAMTKKITGDWKAWGADLRMACKSITKVGSLEKVLVPENLRLKPDNSNRNEVANWENWPKGIDYQAYKHKKQSYFSIQGPYDTFNNIKATLWQNRKEQRSVFTGVTWQNEWTNNAYIDTLDGKPSFGHAFKVFGWKDDYLIAQLSNGVDIGNRGIFYFNKKVVNKTFIYGGFTFSDMPKEEAKYYMSKGITRPNSWLKRILIRLSR